MVSHIGFLALTATTSSANLKFIETESKLNEKHLIYLSGAFPNNLAIDF
jgi:hypothetical protein